MYSYSGNIVEWAKYLSYIHVYIPIGVHMYKKDAQSEKEEKNKTVSILR